MSTAPSSSRASGETSASDGVDFASLVEDRRAHGRIYTDPAVFDAELQRIFHRGWVFVGHESEIPQRGDYRLRPIGRQPAIFVRGIDGQVRVLMNRCTHRGAQVCVEERGNTKLFSCAYHGWTFGNTGQLLGLPGQERYGSGFRREALGLRPAPRVASYRGLTFASLSLEGPTLDEHLGERVKAEIDVAFDLSPLGAINVNAGVHKYGYGGNWKLQLENSVDGYHLNYLHRSYFQIAAARKGMQTARLATGASPARTRSLGNGHVCWDFRPLNKSGQVIGDAPSSLPWRKSYEQALAAAHGEVYARDLLTSGAGHILVFPNLIMLGAHLRVLRPIAVDRTEVFLYPTLLEGVPPEINDERLRQHEAFYGPAGGGATDDLEVFDRINDGLRATVDPWIDVSRGIEDQQIDPDGAISCHITDELGSRAILQHWRRSMTGRSDVSSALPGKITHRPGGRLNVV